MRDPLIDIFGFNAPLVHQAMLALSMMNVEDLAESRRLIERETVIGPLLNPSAYLDGRRFDNALTYVELIDLLLPLVLKARELREEVV